ncbi:MAG: glutamate racemase [Chloroflexia bacterium]|nr:glutamate racemase [Chloroflexia bacterium]
MPHVGPVALFDSGVGGLSVMRHVRELLPFEDLLYYGDNGYCPYGNRPESQVRQRVFSIAAFLLAQGAKMLVLACNTASIAALDDLRAGYPEVPIVGMEPAVKPAARATRNGRIGVLATTVTLHGDRFEKLLQQYAQNVRVFSQPGYGLVERVEAGQVQAAETAIWLRELLSPLIEAGIDTLVLGSTHYAFLRPLIEQVMGPQVTVIDTGLPVARQTRRVLEKSGLGNTGRQPGQELFYTSGEAPLLEAIYGRLWGQPVSLRRQPD